MGPGQCIITADAFIVAKVGRGTCTPPNTTTPWAVTQAAALKQGEEAASCFLFGLFGDAPPINAAQLQPAIAAAATLAVPDAQPLDQFCHAVAQGCVCSQHHAMHHHLHTTTASARSTATTRDASTSQRFAPCASVSQPFASRCVVCWKAAPVSAPHRSLPWTYLAIYMPHGCCCRPCGRGGWQLVRFLTRAT